MELVPDQVRCHVFQGSLDALLPCLVEVHSVDVLENVHARWGLPDLKDGVGIVAKIGRRESRDRRAVTGKRAVNGFAVLDLRTDEDIEILRRSRFRVKANRVSPNDWTLNPVSVEREQELLQIFG
jgi:hypothetical protein